MRTRNKILVTFMVILFAVLVFGTTNVKATNEIEEPKFCIFTIHNSSGNQVEMTGQGDATYQELGCNLSEIASGYYFQLNTQINLGTEITLTGLGDFKLSKTYNSTNVEDTAPYYEYRTAVQNVNSIEDKVRELKFELKDIDSNIVQDFTLVLSFDGILEVTEVKKEDTTTGVKLESTSAVLPSNVVLSVEKVTEQNTLNIVEKSLKDISNEYIVYDITLLQDNAKVQPNGKVKISLPIPSDYDTTNLAVYRIAENGEKTEYQPTVKTADNVKYAVVETDHFSTYVLAEKQVETETVTPPVEETSKLEETKGEKDKTPKTGTIDMIYYILPITVISALGIVLFKKKH